MADIPITLGIAGEQVVIGALRRVGETAINALGAALSTVADFAVDSFKGALEAQSGMDALSATMERLGAKAPLTEDAVYALADQFKGLVGGSDDAVIAMANMGLRFDKIGKDVFPRFIEQAADLATTLKVDPVKASEILGKALQDLSVDGAGSIGRLKAAGVAFTDEQEKLIKKLVESGDIAGAQTVLMDALAATTGGAAAAAAGTAAGQWAIFQETLADAGEGVMLTLMPALTKLMSDVLPQLIPIIEAVAESISTWITNVALPAFMQAVEWVKANWPAIQKSIAEVWRQAQPILQAIWDFIQTVVIPGFQSAVSWVQANWPIIQQKIAEVWAQAQPILQAAWDFLQTVVIPGFNDVVQWIVVNWPTIQATIDRVMTAINTVITTILSGIQAFWDEWGDDILQIVDYATKQIKTIFDAFALLFEGDFRGFGEKLREGFDRAWQEIILIVSKAIEWFLSQDWGKIGSDIIEGIKAGVAAAAVGLANAVAAAAKAAYDAATGFLGIKSPSTLFKGVGKNMMAGMSLGITSGIGGAVGAMRGAVTSVTNATNNSGGNTYNYYGVQANMQYAYQRAVAGAFS